MQTRTIERILVATDGSRDSRAAADYAVALASPLKARVTLVHVAPAADFPLGTTQLGGEAADPGPEDDVSLIKAVWEGSRSVLDDSIGGFERAGVPVEGLIQEGEPVEEILRLLEDDAFDLVVLGRRGTGDSDSELGSTALEVARRAECPVLLVGSN